MLGLYCKTMIISKEIKPLLKRSAFPQDIRPMLATLVEKPFDGDDWLYEVKWDGYRVFAKRKG